MQAAYRIGFRVLRYSSISRPVVHTYLCPYHIALIVRKGAVMCCAVAVSSVFRFSYLLQALSIVVVDEMHLIGDSQRGFLLELMLSKLRMVCSAKVQVTFDPVSSSYICTLDFTPLHFP